jgi:soluble lytic murein transglycosylase-like protein
MRKNWARDAIGETQDEIDLKNDLLIAQKNLNDARLFAKDEIGMRKLAEEENTKNSNNLQLGNPNPDVPKIPDIVPTISRAMIKSIESEAKAALERLQTKQEEINNKIELRQISAIDAYKEQLRLNKEILAVKLQTADREIAAIQGRAPLREASQGAKTVTPQFEGALRQYTNAITAAADKWKVPAEYIQAVMSKENASGKLDAVGENIRNGQVVSRDLGLMQINDKAHPEFNANKLLTDAAYNINAGTKILSESLKAFPNDLVKGFAAYNAGIGGAEKGVSREYGEDVSKRANVSLKQIAQGATDSADISVQLDAKERANEEDRQATKEAEKLLAVRQKELTTLSNVIEVDFLRAKGLREQADILELNNKYRIQEELLGINGLEVEKAKVLQIKSAEALQLGLNRVTERRNIAEQVYKDKVQETNTLLNAGVLSQREAATLLNDSKKTYLSLQDAEIKKLQEILALNSSNLQAQDTLNNIKRSKQGEIAQGIGGLNSTIQSGMPGDLQYIDQYQTDSVNNESSKTLADDANTKLYENKLITHEEFLKNKALLDDKYATANTITQQKLYFNIASSAGAAFQDLSNIMADVYGKNSKQARAAFAAQKAMSIVQAGINVAEGVTKAIAQGGYLGILTGAMVAATGAISIAKIVAAPMPQAHAGLTNVPEDQTYLLKKNERVLAPQQNRDLTNALKDGTMGGKQVVNNKIINVLDPSIVGDYLSTTEGENMIVNIVNRNKAG